MGSNRKRELERNSCCSSNGRQQTRKNASLMPKNRALVSIFPVIEANVASITCATTGILSSSLFLYLVSVSNISYVENNLNELSKIKTGKSLVTKGSLSCFFILALCQIGLMKQF